MITSRYGELESFASLFFKINQEYHIPYLFCYFQLVQHQDSKDICQFPAPPCTFSQVFINNIAIIYLKISLSVARTDCT